MRPTSRPFQRATRHCSHHRHHAARITDCHSPIFGPPLAAWKRWPKVLAVGLQSRGHAVEVATYALTERSAIASWHPIIDLTFPADFETTSPYSMLGIERLIESGHYGCCILLGAPLHLMFMPRSAIPKDRPVRFILQPTINKEIAESLQGKRAGRTVVSTGTTRERSRHVRRQWIRRTVLSRTPDSDLYHSQRAPALAPK